MGGQIADEIKQKRRRKLYGLTLFRKVGYNLRYTLRGFKPFTY